MHDVWWCAKLVPTTYKWPQPGQGTRGRCWWDQWALSVNTNDWGITHGRWNKEGVECVEELGVIKETRWGKVDVLGIIWWGGGDMSWWFIQVITVLESYCDIRWHFDDGEMARVVITICIK